MLDEGLPRRKTLLLHSDEKVHTAFLTRLRFDQQVFIAMKAKPEAWAMFIARSSPFQTRAVQQLCVWLKDENWKNTCRTCVIFMYGNSLGLESKSYKVRGVSKYRVAPKQKVITY